MPPFHIFQGYFYPFEIHGWIDPPVVFRLIAGSLYYEDRHIVVCGIFCSVGIELRLCLHRYDSDTYSSGRDLNTVPPAEEDHDEP